MTRSDGPPDTLEAMTNHLADTAPTIAAPSGRAPFDPNAEAVALRSIEIMSGGSLEDFQAVIHPECVNREAKDEPPATRGRGPKALYATAQWAARGLCRPALGDPRGRRRAGPRRRLHCTMSGQHVGDFVTYIADGAVGDVFPPTRKRFATTQSHWLRVRDGKVIEHWANRDDLGTAQQLGWVPPTPPYLVRMAWAKRRARRRERAAA